MGLQDKKNEDNNHYIKHTTFWSASFKCHYETCLRGSPIWISIHRTRLISTVLNWGSLSLTVSTKYTTTPKCNCTRYCCSNSWLGPTRAKLGGKNTNNNKKTCHCHLKAQHNLHILLYSHGSQIHEESHWELQGHCWKKQNNSHVL